MKSKFYILFGLLLPWTIEAQNLFQQEISLQAHDLEVFGNNTVNFTSSTLQLHGKDGSHYKKPIYVLTMYLFPMMLKSTMFISFFMQP